MNQPTIKKISLAIVATLALGAAAMAQNMRVAPGRDTGPTHMPDSLLINAFGGNLEVNACTGCNFDEVDGGYYVWGSQNCEASGVTQWIAVPFISKRTGNTRQITAGVELDNACTSLGTQFTLGIYNNDCTTGVGVAIATGVARASAGPCVTARARVAAALTTGTRYWVAATTTATQDQFSGIWYGSNQAQIGGNVANGGWFVFSGFVPSFSVD